MYVRVNEIDRAHLFLGSADFLRLPGSRRAQQTTGGRPPPEPAGSPWTSTGLHPRAETWSRAWAPPVRRHRRSSPVCAAVVETAAAPLQHAKNAK